MQLSKSSYQYLLSGDIDMALPYVQIQDVSTEVTKHFVDELIDIFHVNTGPVITKICRFNGTGVCGSGTESVLILCTSHFQILMQ